MRVVRFSHGDRIGYGVVDDDALVELVGDPLVTGFDTTGQRLALSDVRLLAPVIPRSKIVAVGRNYAKHAAEMGNDVPTEPLVFLKPNTSVIGPEEPIIYPDPVSELAYEGELALVIGRICRDVPAERVDEVIFGYTVANDVTARDLQRTDDQWARAKGYDTFCPLGPWITTHQSVEEMGDVMITTTVDGQQRQHDSSSLMLHGIVELVVYISAFTTLLPGDVILTGTPAGVGELLPGHEVSVTVDGIGTLTNTVIRK